jgi:hypothetical protein
MAQSLLTDHTLEWRIMKKDVEKDFMGDHALEWFQG